MERVIVTTATINELYERHMTSAKARVAEVTKAIWMGFPDWCVNGTLPHRPAGYILPTRIAQMVREYSGLDQLEYIPTLAYGENVTSKCLSSKREGSRPKAFQRLNDLTYLANKHEYVPHLGSYGATGDKFYYTNDDLNANGQQLPLAKIVDRT